ncbi:hypothetical protein BKA67DRAFT_534081 [Truncatella angustata]|uniref:Transmembrane protein n=1 Tax=Truncatella angustata TaxID=152316 RepID=A0A9P8UMW9_9PEZI|nr:uncharacterized protein BKA67DRAFT_534081 [Truncatella angustata]KAH6655143.1 hypothetical protein BKA67DRAFT_534081 [Truncatella angustata]KAH8200429.1 hypothetical protein TruAng_005392 [Truncatella angustata]
MGNDANGFLLPSWYTAEQPSDLDLNIASIIWGFSLALAVFTLNKGIRQSWKAHKRGKLWNNTYIIMVWAEWFVCVAISIISWLYLSPSLSILPGFWIFFGLLCLWVIQIQCILQIIINRVRLLMVDQRKADYLKWSVAIFVGLINISVFIIWIPARLEISQRWIDINNWWDRAEKILFGLCDIGLNLYFIYLVRSKLVANGLKKYERLLRFNMMMIFLSMSMDVVLIGMMSLPNTAIYIQFHPLVYLVKLHIEMNVAELIAKIVKASNDLNEYRNNNQSIQITNSNGNTPNSHEVTRSGGRSNLRQKPAFQTALGNSGLDTAISGKSAATDGSFDKGPDLELGWYVGEVWADTTTNDEAAIVCESSTSRGTTAVGEDDLDGGLENESASKPTTTHAGT